MRTKLLFSLILLFNISTFAQDALIRPNVLNCEKKAQKETFKLKKEGWILETDANVDLKAALTRFFILDEDLDRKKQKNFLFAEGLSTADSKSGGFLEATDMAKQSLSTQLISIIDTALASKLNTKNITEVEKSQIKLMLDELKDNITRKMYKANVLFKVYRTNETNSLVPENKIETAVKIFEEKKYLFELGISETLKIFKNRFGLTDDELNKLL